MNSLQKGKTLNTDCQMFLILEIWYILVQNILGEASLINTYTLSVLSQCCRLSVDCELLCRQLAMLFCTLEAAIHLS